MDYLSTTVKKLLVHKCPPMFKFDFEVIACSSTFYALHVDEQSSSFQRGFIKIDPLVPYIPIVANCSEFFLIIFYHFFMNRM